MSSFCTIKDLNSKGSYLSAIEHIRTFSEQDVSLAARGQPKVDYLQKIQVLRELKQELRIHALHGRTPLRLQGVHQLLEEALQDVIKRVDTIAQLANLSSKKSGDENANPDLETILVKSLGALGGAAFISSPFWLPKADESEPFQRKDNVEDEISIQEEKDSGQELKPDERLDEKIEEENYPKIENLNAHQKHSQETDHSDLIFEPFDRNEVFDVENWKREIFPNNGTESETCIRPVLIKKESPVKRVIDPPINRYVRELCFLGELLLARHALNHASPFRGLATAHRVYHIIRLSGVHEELNKTMPLLADTAEKASDVFNAIETASPFSISDMLEHMTSLDAWAMIGLMDLVREEVPGIRTVAGSIPGPLWKFIQFAPFAFRNNLRILPATIPNLVNETNGTRLAHPESDPRLMTTYLKDIAYILFLYSAAQGLNGAAPVLKVAAAHHIFQILRLSNITEDLKTKMPLVVGGLEKVASLYQKIEAITPSFISGLFEDMMSMDAWAAVGLIDHCRGMPGLEWMMGKIPLLSSVDAHQRWQFLRFAPFLIGSTLLTSLYSNVGLNFQANLLQ